MENGERGLRNKYILFVGVSIVITFFTQILIYQYLNAQYADAGLINVAGRQRMLSQRITKLALYIQRDKLAGVIPTDRQDSLRSILATWNASHEMLLSSRANKTVEIDSLLVKQTALLRATFAAGLKLASTDDRAAIADAMRTIEENDLPFLTTMDQIVSLYQHRAEAKIENAERMEFVLAALSMIMIVAGFIFIVRPSINELRSSNYALSVLNFELTAKEEQLRANFDKVNGLQLSLEKREKEYRERVDEAADIIYEMDHRGYYNYTNVPMTVFTGYSRDELVRMHYYDLVAPKYRDEVVKFYQQQVAERRERSQYEFPIITKNDQLFWISQSLRIIYSDHGIEKIHAIARDITALQKSREALVKSEKRFKSFADQSPVGIYELNAEGVMIYMNSKYNEISGIDESTPPEERAHAIHAADRDATVKTWRNAFEMKKAIRLEFRFDHPEKGVVWVVSHASPRFDDDWKFLGYLGTLSDVTLQKNAFQQLQESEETYRLISTNSAELISLFKNDATLTRTFVSPSVKTILGYEPDELIGVSGFEIMHPYDLAATRNRAGSAKSEVISGVRESRVRKKDGTYVWMESSNQAVYNEHGDIIGIQSSARDITERKRIEDALEERERLYRLLSENTRDLIALHNVDSTYQFVSSSFQKILGYSSEDLIGISPLSLTHPEDVVWIMEKARQEPMTLSSQINFESRMRDKQGEYHWIETYIQPIGDEHGNVASFQSSSREVSRRKAAEVEATEARVKAEQANLAKSQFLSMMSHEIRTPMNAVIGLTNFMIEENPDARQAENLRLLKYSGDNLLAIINDILDFSKIEAGKIELDLVSFDLSEMLQNIIKMMGNRASAKQVALILSVPNDLPQYVIGDSVRINQILINLLSNAIKFTDKGEVSLEVEVKTADDLIYNISFAVRDTGVGIASDKIEMIFESFTQASKDTTRKFGGTGLGLAISQRLVNLMGSHIEVKSEPGKGSVFYFTLDFRKGSAVVSQKVIGRSLDRVQSKNYEILLVEDNTVNQIVATNYLRKWGLTVTIANDGEEALTRITEKEWDIVLMDMQMPVMDGYEATRRIRDMKGDFFKALPIIALTASVMADREKILKENGLTDYVNKPFQPEELYEKIFLHLSKADKADNDPEIDMHRYSFSNPEDEKVLATFMAENINELINAFLETLQRKDVMLFRAASHKSKTTLAIINDPKFTTLHEEVDNTMKNDPEPWSALENKRDAYISSCKRKAALLGKRIAAV